MADSYFTSNRHSYMSSRSRLFAEYIYSLVSDDSFSGHDTAIELGAGTGRFSHAVVLNFPDVTLVEPVASYAAILRESFTADNVRVVNRTAADFLADHEVERPAMVFCFHLLHHLDHEQRAAIFRFVRRTDSVLVAVEPNSFNPLILLQILLSPDMSIAGEMRYLTLTPGKLRQEIEDHGLSLSSSGRLCFFPPFVADLLLGVVPRPLLTRFERLTRALPFTGAYQSIVCQVPER